MGILSVSQLTMLIQREISFNPYLKNLEVQAEVARLTRHSAGHLYFTIKDTYSSIDCVMFKSQVQRLKQPFHEGDKVLLKGQISLYEKNARLQFYVSSVEPLGDGVFLKAFYELKEKLEKEGLLNEENKRPIPLHPKKIALLTSPTGAAVKDFLKVFHRRNPLCEIILYPVTVQGENVSRDILNTLKSLPYDIDLVVITRGGGNYEDLRFFNDEALARGVAAYPKPVISAIGHEVDFTIIEFVSDKRGATPTEAAELATADINQPLRQFEDQLKNFTAIFKHRLSLQKQTLKNRFQEYFQFTLEKRCTELERAAYENQVAMLQNVQKRLRHEQAQLNLFLSAFQKKTQALRDRGLRYKDNLHKAIADRLNEEEKNLLGFGQFLAVINPLQTLTRGYSYLEQDGKKIVSVQDIKKDKPLKNFLQDGAVLSQVVEVIENEF